MKVNPKTVVFVLELFGTLALAAGGVVVKHFIGGGVEIPELER